MEVKSFWPVLALGLCIGAPGYGGDIYKWVDAQGRVHVSDRPPREYKNSAVRDDSKRHDLSGAERQHAQERTQKQHEKLSAAEAERTPRGQKAQGPNDRPDIDDRPKPSRLSDAECAEWYQAYWESEACYEPFRGPRRSLKPGAFEACGAAVLDPSWDCGPPKIHR